MKPREGKKQLPKYCKNRFLKTVTFLWNLFELKESASNHSVQQLRTIGAVNATIHHAVNQKTNISLWKKHDYDYDYVSVWKIHVKHLSNIRFAEGNP